MHHAIYVQSNLCVPPQDSVEISTGIASPGKSRNLQRNDIIMSTLKVAFAVEQRDWGHAAVKGGPISHEVAYINNRVVPSLGRPKERSKTP